VELQGTVSSSIREKVATITFGHPKSNSLPSKLLKNLTEEIQTASSNKDVNVIILRSEGTTTFCGGALFDELQKVKDIKKGKDFFMGFASLINAMRKCSKFIITRVQGKAVGGGVGIIAASDYVFATNISHVKLSELALGIGPFIVGPAIERKIGKAAFSSLAIDTDWHDAFWAKNTGLFTKVFAATTELDEEIHKLAEHLAKYNLEAMIEVKKMFWEGTENWDELLEQRAEMSGRLILSDHAKSYLKNFAAK
jgi:methylglutaconyl-CoA hydratase